MALPSKKRPKSEKRKRALHYQLRKIKLFKCPKCQKPILAHRACSFCGTYAGRQVLNIKMRKGKTKEKK